MVLIELCSARGPLRLRKAGHHLGPRAPGTVHDTACAGLCGGLSSAPASQMGKGRGFREAERLAPGHTARGRQGGHVPRSGRSSSPTRVSLGAVSSWAGDRIVPLAPSLRLKVVSACSASETPGPPHRPGSSRGAGPVPPTLGAASHSAFCPPSTRCPSSPVEVLVLAPARGPPPDAGGPVLLQLAPRCPPRSRLPAGA